MSVGLVWFKRDLRLRDHAALAEAASWLMNHLRWDVQDDVARFLASPDSSDLLPVLAARLDGSVLDAARFQSLYPGQALTPRD